MAPSDHLARLVGDFAGGGGGKELGLVDHHQHRVPVVALGIEHAAEKGRGAAHLLLEVEALEIEHHRDAVLADAAGNAGQLGFGAGAVDHQMAELVGERDEVALRVDDALLNPRRALLEQAAQEVRLAGPGIALHQQAGRQQFLEIEQRRGAGRGLSHLDGDGHAAAFHEVDRKKLLITLSNRKSPSNAATHR